MDTLSQFSDQLRMLIEHHMPAEAACPLATAVPTGIIARGPGTAGPGGEGAELAETENLKRAVFGCVGCSPTCTTW